MVSIDQILHFVEFHKIGREGTEARRHRKDKYLFTNVYLSDQMIRVAFYLSKMTVIDELRDGPLEFSHIRFVEFLEFVARLAHLFFESTSQHFEWGLHEKIEVLLSWLFRPGNHTLKNAHRSEYQSDSDGEYGEEVA